MGKIKFIVLMMTLLMSFFISAEAWQVGKHINVSSETELDVTFQIMDEFDPNEKLVHGWKGDELKYILVAERQIGVDKPEAFWEFLFDDLKENSDDNNVETLSEGLYTSDRGDEISYKILSTNEGGELNIQMFNLIVGKKEVYFLLAMPFDNDVDYMTENVIALLKSTKLLR